MPTLTSAIDTDFTPVVGDFIAQASGGTANLLRKNTGPAPFTLVGTFQGAVVVSNPVAGAVYRFSAPAGVTVQADQ
jgi:hypothetical protein